MKKLTGKYGLPLEVKFCKKCTMNNQRPSSTIEFNDFSRINSKEENISVKAVILKKLF